MKRGRKLLICTLAGLAVGTTANAATSGTSGSPYEGIVVRNVFGLNKAPPPPDPEANKPPPPKIFLTGITTILGNKRALMKLTPPAKPGEPAKEQSFTLAEKQRDGELEVLEIDENAGTVKVNDYGTITTLSFTNNGIKTAAAPGPAGAPNPAGFVPAPGANPAMPAGGASPFARPLRLPTPAGGVSSAATGSAAPVYASGSTAYAGSPLAYGGGISVPSAATTGLAVGGTSVPLSGSTTVQPQPQTAPSPASQLSADQQFLLVEAERARLQQQQAQGINLSFPPLPPTPLTRELNPEPTPAPTTTPTATIPSLPRAPSLPPILPHP